MRTRDAIIGFVFLVILIGGILIIKNRSNKTPIESGPLPTPSIQQRIENKFGGIKIPDDVSKVELKDTTGGDSYGIATQTEVLANLPDLSKGEFYEVWVNQNGKLISLGKMRIAKGGYILEGNIGSDKVIVSREKIYDNRIELKVLE